MNQVMNPAVQKLSPAFQMYFYGMPELFARAPGSVNLIGEHTDYNEGFVFPCAINREFHALFRKNPAKKSVHVYSIDYQEADEFDLDFDESEKSKAFPWSNYLRGVLFALREKNIEVGGFDVAISGDIPQGAGLSSSAAYELAIATGLNELFDLKQDPKALALLCKKGENNYVGVNCGIMDQMISAMGEEDSALKIDCRTFESEAVPLKLQERGLRLVVTESGVERELLESAYNDRREECEQAVKQIAEASANELAFLRDVDSKLLEQHQSALEDKVLRRARHVVSENERVIAAVAALKEDRLEEFGRLMKESHNSLRDDFEVSCNELNKLVNLTNAHAGVIGSRMTGAGFGGCTVSIMTEAAANSFEADVIAPYEKETGKQAKIHFCQAVKGASSHKL